MSTPRRPGTPRAAQRPTARPEQRPEPRVAARGKPRTDERATAPAERRTPPRRTAGPATGGQRRAATRPSGPSGPGRTPAPTLKPRIEPARPRGSWSAMVSWRSAVLAGVVILSLAVLLPTLRVYVEQQGELRELRAEKDQARAEVDHLEAEVARWDDPAFVVAQARERLGFVFPGETPYRVIDPEFVTTHAEGSPAAAANPAAGSETPWFFVVWESILVAGNGPPVVEAPDQPEEAEAEPLTDVDFGR